MKEINDFSIYFNIHNEYLNFSNALKLSNEKPKIKHYYI